MKYDLKNKTLNGYKCKKCGMTWLELDSQGNLVCQHCNFKDQKIKDMGEQ